MTYFFRVREHFLGVVVDMDIIAEGVETQEALEFVRSRDCDLAHGYICSPMPGREFES